MKKKKNNTDCVRVNIELTPTADKQLAELQELLGYRSKVDVFRRSLTTTEVLVRHEATGGKVVLRHKDGSEETLKFV